MHGGADSGELRALGVDPEGVVDLSANLHPHGMSEGVRAALASAAWRRYPPAGAAPLRDAIARHERVAPEMVLPVAGATAGIHLVARVYAAGARAVILGPTFGEYRAAVDAAGGEAVEVRAAAPAFAPPIARVPRAPLGFLCNPNNPSGVFLDRAAVEEVLTRLGGLLVLDAAYEPFTEPRWDSADLVREGRDVLVVRSMTKLHAMPGVRLGYLVGRPPAIAQLGRVQHSWSLDAAAHAVAPVALAETEARVCALRAMRAVRETLRAALERAGCTVAPSRANFLLVRVGDGARVRAALMRRGYVVRDCASFGLPEWVRFAVPRAEQRAAYARALLDVIEVCR